MPSNITFLFGYKVPALRQPGEILPPPPEAVCSEGAAQYGRRPRDLYVCAGWHLPFERPYIWEMMELRLRELGVPSGRIITPATVGKENLFPSRRTEPEISLFREMLQAKGYDPDAVAFNAIAAWPMHRRVERLLKLRKMNCTGMTPAWDRRMLEMWGRLAQEAVAYGLTFVDPNGPLAFIRKVANSYTDDKRTPPNIDLGKYDIPRD